jgi:NAD-dependent dihydropyrimidine dehydrogenase PreA subunit
MAYIISDDCISCGNCEGECPTDSISEGPEHYDINPDTCIDCGACADMCPVDAISAE